MMANVSRKALMTGALGMAAAMAMSAEAFAKPDLTRRCQELPELVLGTDEAGFGVSQKEYTAEPAKCYKLEIKSTGKQEYALRGPSFFRNIWLRKVEAGGLEIKPTHLYELEFEDEAEAEIYFAFVKPGKYTLYAAGLEKKGVVINFTVK